MDKFRWQQVEQLYNEALEIPSAERESFLTEKCAGDADLYREVESLLASSEQDDSFLAEPEFDLGLQLLSKTPGVLKEGQNFGNYTILNFLGRGGMGEVYLAQDARLGRLIALKVLPAEVSANRDRVQRFMQEARAASALNHPNLLTIHEIGEFDGWRFIASEYVEGETLRERLKREGPPAPAQTVEIALQIAAALNAAHKAGIIHRDIKPENIMLREDGLVKVLDFGLAKLMENLNGQNFKESLISTTPGMIMGTVAYMSPEQVRGQKTDTRSDIWSFGVVLYEMLTGKLPFKGDTTSDMIAAILTAELSLPEQNYIEKPETLRQIAAKALRKNPAQRYQTATEITEDLRQARLDADSFPEAENDFSQATAYKQIGETDSRLVRTEENLRQYETHKIEKKSGRKTLGLVLAAILLLALAGSFTTFYFSKNQSWFSRQPMKIDRIFDTGKTFSAAISPDGKYIAHALLENGEQSLWIKHIATNSNVQLIAPDKAGFSGLSFSKDGNYIYYLQNGALYQIPVLGGDPKKIYEGVDSLVSFSPDGQKFAFLKELSKEENSIVIVNADGSGEQQFAARKDPESFSGEPAWSPDGKIIACPVFLKNEKALMNIALLPVEGGEEKLLSAQKWIAVWGLKWLPDGSGLLGIATPQKENNLSQVWFFPASGEDARLITNDLNQYEGISLTADARQFLTIQWENRSNIWILPNGKTEEARILSNNVHALYRFIDVAPDGRIVFPSNIESDSARNIWIMNADGSNAKQLTANAGGNILPCVTGDGRYIVFVSNRADLETFHIWRMNMDGTNPVQLTNGKNEGGPVCSPDGQTVFYTSGGPAQTPDEKTIWKISIDGGEPVQLTDYPSHNPDVSPDGKFLVIRFKFENSPFKLGIIPVTGGKPEKTFDFRQQSFLKWKPDGSAITYIKTENGVSNIWSQPVNGEPPQPITKFTAETISGFDWTKNNDLVCTRGFQTRDPILISNFR